MPIESFAPRATARQSRRVEVFLDSAVAALVHKAIDRVTVHDICAAAGSTRTTFYSYFGNLEGIYADLWITRGRQLVSKVLRGELLADDERETFSAIVAVLTISKRSSEIAEALALEGSSRANTPDDMWLTSSIARLWLLASMIGWELSKSVLPPNSQPIHHMECLRLSGQIQELRSPVRPIGLHEPMFEVSSVRDLIMASAYSVIATAGLAKTSMVRVARRAGLSTATCYDEFSDLTDLAVQTYVTAQGLINENHLSASKDVRSSSEQLVALIAGTLSNSRKTWREFRQEVFLDATHNSRLGEFLRSQSLALENVTGLYAQVLGTDARLAIDTSSMVHCLGLGLGVLHNLGVDTRLSKSLAVAEHLLVAHR